MLDRPQSSPAALIFSGYFASTMSSRYLHFSFTPVAESDCYQQHHRWPSPQRRSLQCSCRCRNEGHQRLRRCVPVSSCRIFHKAHTRAIPAPKSEHGSGAILMGSTTGRACISRMKKNLWTAQPRSPKDALAEDFPGRRSIGQLCHGICLRRHYRSRLPKSRSPPRGAANKLLNRNAVK